MIYKELSHRRKNVFVEEGMVCSEIFVGEEIFLTDISDEIIFKHDRRGMSCSLLRAVLDLKIIILAKS